MNRSHRREFLADVGRGMLVASVGSVVAQDLGLASAALADDSASRLTFGADRAAGRLHAGDARSTGCCRPSSNEIKSGEDFGRLVAAAALANARTFGGQDYEGYHTIMALVPAYQMSRELPESQKALPVLKVLYRNTNHIQQMGGQSHEALHPVAPAQLSAGQCGGEALREATRRRDVEGAERTFAALTEKSARRGVQRPAVPGPGLRRRPPGGPGLAGLGLARPGRQGARPHAASPIGALLLRRGEATPRTTPLRDLLPELLETRACSSESPKEREATTSGSKSLSQTIYASSRQQAAEAVAEALRRGILARGRRRGDLAGREPARAARPRPQEGRLAGQADRQRPRGLGRRARLRCRQRLAEHRPREQPPQHGRQPDRRRLSHGRAGGRPQSQAVSVRRAPREGRDGRTRRACSPRPRPPSRPRTRSAPVPWCTATASWAARRGRSSTCCSATPSAKTAPFTPRSTTAPSPKSSPSPGRLSAGTIWRASPASPPASTATRRRALPEARKLLSV